MNIKRVAYLPLPSFPEAISEAAIHAALAFARDARIRVQATCFAVSLPPMSSGLGDLFIDVPGLVRAGEQKSRTECERLARLLDAVAKDGSSVRSRTCGVRWGAEAEEAALEARLYDLTLLPWSAEDPIAQTLAQAVVFGSGRPAVLVPASRRAGPIDHLAVAWDGSRVAARALGDAWPLLAPGGRVSVLTVDDEKRLSSDDPGRSLARALEDRGMKAVAVRGRLKGRSISAALQEIALDEGAGLLAMGGFGHSRLRDFVLGGATRGVLEDLRLATLLSH